MRETLGRSVGVGRESGFGTDPGFGLYIHIPFCRRKCSYCGFYSTACAEGTVADRAEAYREALVKEAAARTAHQGGRVKLDTLYVGGGTPSLLPVSFYDTLLRDLSAYFDSSALREATFEANPEHLDAAYLQRLYAETPFRRLSIGVQSFFDEDLVRLNRKHTAEEAVSAVEAARKAGFENISVDLIYGLPWRDEAGNGKAAWLRNLEWVERLAVPHFSCYALTVEPGTILEKQIEKGMIPAPDEGVQAEDYFALQQWAEEHGYEAYEISNYARPGRESVHNSRYWKLKPYIGLGAAAHSFFREFELSRGGRRWWNVSDLKAYTADPVGSRQGEDLSERDLYHEYVMTALRTIWGVEDATMRGFSEEIRSEFEERAAEQVRLGNLERRGEGWAVPAGKRFLTDGISVNFF